MKADGLPPYPFPAQQGPARRIATHPSSPALPATVITGPAGSGKTTLVNDLKRWGDLVMDVDALFVAMSGLPWNEKPKQLLPYVVAARDAVLATLARRRDVAAWVITSNGDMVEVVNIARQVNAKIIVLAVDRLECSRRVSQDPQRHRWDLYNDMINAWWEKFEKTRHALPPGTDILTNE